MRAPASRAAASTQGKVGAISGRTGTAMRSPSADASSARAIPIRCRRAGRSAALARRLDLRRRPGSTPVVTRARATRLFTSSSSPSGVDEIVAQDASVCGRSRSGGTTPWRTISSKLSRTVGPSTASSSRSTSSRAASSSRESRPSTFSRSRRARALIGVRMASVSARSSSSMRGSKNARSSSVAVGFGSSEPSSSSSSRTARRIAAHEA